MDLNHGSPTWDLPSLPPVPPNLATANIQGICADYDPIPEAILEETDTHYNICIRPDVAGITTFISSSFQKCTVPKAALAAAYPDIVEAWETEKRRQRHEALKIKRSMLGYAYYFRGEEEELRDRDPGVACDQNLLPGMKRHWGELRSCKKHWSERPDFQVCKGCRVAHHTQTDQDFDRSVIMTRGARVPMCEDCAANVVEEFGVEHRGCVCDSKWTCARCREEELKKMAKARRRYMEGRCGECGRQGALAEDVEVCLYCGETRTYERST
jgi:hypothetical protein